MSGQKKRSHYAEKRASGNMMYGPDCCAHTVTAPQVEAAKRRGPGIPWNKRGVPIDLDAEEYSDA